MDASHLRATLCITAAATLRGSHLLPEKDEVGLIVPLTDVCTYVVCLFFFNIKFIIARLLLCQTALARLLLCQTAVFLGLYAPRLPIFLCFCQTAAVWEIGQSGNLKRVVGWGVSRGVCASRSF